MFFLLFPYKSIIDHGLRLNTRPNMPLGQRDTAILVVGRDIYLDFKRIWKKKESSSLYQAFFEQDYKARNKDER